MAISFIATNGAVDGSTTELTYSLNAGTGSNRIVVVGTSSDLAPTSVTYAGVAMVQINTQTVGLVHRIYYLINPTSGTNNVVISFGGSSAVTSAAASYSGINTGNPLGNNTTNSTTGTELTTSFSVTYNNSWVVVYAKNSVDDVIAGTGLTARSALATWRVLDSDSSQTSGSHDYQTTGSASQTISHNIVEIREGMAGIMPSNL